MATDAVYSTQLIDAMITQLSTYLPAGWTSTATGEVKLQLLDCGGLSDYAAEQDYALETPAIIIRPLDLRPDANGSGIGGDEMVAHGFRLVHIRRWEDCRNDAGAVEKNQTRARARYAKIIHKALFHDPYGRLGSPSLTTADTNAKVLNVSWSEWDLGRDRSTAEVVEIRDLRQHLWAIALDLEVQVDVIV